MAPVSLPSTTVTPEPCETCGGALGPSSTLPPCLCELGPPEPRPTEPAPPEAKGGGETHAKALRCPSCGGWLESGMRRCTYCKVELASVRCWRCFDLSFAGSERCAGCGASLGLEGDLGPTDARCPDCDEALHLIDVGEHRVQECESCAGLLVDHDTLRHLTDLREAEAGVSMPGQVKRQPLSGRSVRYRSCPACEHIMTPRNFGGRSGIVVDVCKDHGVWFDEDELTHVLEFVASGGLRDQRRREIEDAKMELSRKRVDALHEQMRVPHSTYEAKQVHSASALVSALVDVGSWFF